MSQIIAMSKRLQEYEQIIETLKEKVSWASGSSPDSNVAGGDIVTLAHVADISSDYEQEINNTRPTAIPDHYASQQDQISALPLSDLSLDGNGKVRSTDTTTVQIIDQASHYSYATMAQLQQCTILRYLHGDINLWLTKQNSPCFLQIWPSRCLQLQMNFMNGSNSH